MAHAVALLPEYGEPAAVAATGRAEQLRVKTVRQLRQAGRQTSPASFIYAHPPPRLRRQLTATA